MKSFLLFFALLLITPTFATAALIHAEGTLTGGESSVTLFLDTEGQSVNALEGTILVPPSFRLTEIRDGNSSVNFWVERPEINENRVRFSGIIPGGTLTTRSELFTLVMDVENPSGVLALEDARAFLNDGSGTSVKLTLKKGIATGEVLVLQDTSPPEIFTPIRENSTEYLGKAFIVFATQDKGSGIDHYEVGESVIPPFMHALDLFFSYERVESPYQINNNAAYVYVQAFDKEGNVRGVVVEPSEPLTLRVILAGLFAILLLILWWRWRRG